MDELPNNEETKLSLNGEESDFEELTPEDVCPGDEIVQAKPASTVKACSTKRKRGRKPIPVELIAFVADCLGARMRAAEIHKHVESVLEREVSMSTTRVYIQRARQYLQIRHGRPVARVIEESLNMLESVIRDETMDPRVRMEAQRELLVLLGAHPLHQPKQGSTREAPEQTARRIREALKAADESVPEE